MKDNPMDKLLDLAPVPLEPYELSNERVTDIKYKINQIIWENSRPSMTLEQADRLAADIHARLLEGMR